MSNQETEIGKKQVYTTNKNIKQTIEYQKPSGTFICISWIKLFLGVSVFIIGLWKAKKILLNERGYYFSTLMYGLFSVISIQKSVRDKLEGIPVTEWYYGLVGYPHLLCWYY
jgi:uncharacterized membrane protein YiaA